MMSRFGFAIRKSYSAVTRRVFRSVSHIFVVFTVLKVPNNITSHIKILSKKEIQT